MKRKGSLVISGRKVNIKSYGAGGKIALCMVDVSRSLGASDPVESPYNQCKSRYLTISYVTFGSFEL